ncbi:MAG: 3-ketoacyl-ACP reductase [Alcanivorax sp.]|nr:3-ketoacyl-ACP reductase [Alcanivorax sp.]MBM1144701.1 SDR family oxidoreductase [Alcanivorax sp. ZXX171]UWN51332.1 3-oxoacyl-[acyl-carrier-protein] reductase FabG [Alcanivorax sp. ALC70]MAY09078.1 3-ketoacyl-ACP reductase [Alcanivorax sp.]MBI54774.1 3-ketoacyl-ACP reductase [Alcanivorax sp.]|tara:strand:- start:132 stop:884 length:753 start_codon:yes stop_codon:yes gene_type:complete
MNSTSSEPSSKVALVTGASRGIGRAIALRLARDGFAVVVNYARSETAAREVVDAIEADGGRALAVPADVGDEQDVARLFDTAEQTLGGVRVVVNSAGELPMAPIETGRLADFDRVIRTNLRGTFLVLAEAAARLGEGGRIIALSTSVIAKALPAYGPYIASKAGVEGLVRVLANELRGRHITVNAVAPGPVGTDLFLDGKPQALIDQLAAQAPLERLGEPDDIAGVVSFLAGPDGGWVNAQVLRANGGFA